MIAGQFDTDRNWRAAIGDRAISFAERWFGAAQVSTAQLFSEVDPELGQALLEQQSWEGNTLLSPSFVLLPHGYPTGRRANPRIDDVVPWDRSPSTGRLAQILSSLEIEMTPIGDRICGWWPTTNGGSSVQFAAIMRASDGSEYLNWYSTPLASVGTMIDNDEARLSLTASIPSLLQTTTYLAEAPNPLEPDALFMSGGRNRVLYGADAHEANTPSPVATLIMPGDATSAQYWVRDLATGLVESRTAGGAIVLSYAIDLQSNDYVLSRGVQVAVTSALRLAGIFEDGFLNFQEGDTAFERVLWSQVATVNDADQAWIPTSLA